MVEIVETAKDVGSDVYGGVQAGANLAETSIDVLKAINRGVNDVRSFTNKLDKRLSALGFKADLAEQAISDIPDMISSMALSPEDIMVYMNGLKQHRDGKLTGLGHMLDKMKSAVQINSKYRESVGEFATKAAAGDSQLDELLFAQVRQGYREIIVPACHEDWAGGPHSCPRDQLRIGTIDGDGHMLRQDLNSPEIGDRTFSGMNVEIDGGVTLVAAKEEDVKSVYKSNMFAVDLSNGYAGEIWSPAENETLSDEYSYLIPKPVVDEHVSIEFIFFTNKSINWYWTQVSENIMSEVLEYLKLENAISLLREKFEFSKKLKSGLIAGEGPLGKMYEPISSISDHADSIINDFKSLMVNPDLLLQEKSLTQSKFAKKWHDFQEPRREAAYKFPGPNKTSELLKEKITTRSGAKLGKNLYKLESNLHSIDDNIGDNDYLVDKLHMKIGIMAGAYNPLQYPYQIGSARCLDDRFVRDLTVDDVDKMNRRNRSKLMVYFPSIQSIWVHSALIEWVKNQFGQDKEIKPYISHVRLYKHEDMGDEFIDALVSDRNMVKGGYVTEQGDFIVGINKLNKNLDWTDNIISEAKKVRDAVDIDWGKLPSDNWDKMVEKLKKFPKEDSELANVPIFKSIRYLNMMVEKIHTVINAVMNLPENLDIAGKNLKDRFNTLATYVDEIMKFAGPDTILSKLKKLGDTFKKLRGLIPKDFEGNFMELLFEYDWNIGGKELTVMQKYANELKQAISSIPIVSGLNNIMKGVKEPELFGELLYEMAKDYKVSGERLRNLLSPEGNVFRFKRPPGPGPTPTPFAASSAEQEKVISGINYEPLIKGVSKEAEEIIKQHIDPLRIGLVGADFPKNKEEVESVRKQISSMNKTMNELTNHTEKLLNTVRTQQEMLDEMKKIRKSIRSITSPPWMEMIEDVGNDFDRVIGKIASALGMRKPGIRPPPGIRPRPHLV